MEEPNVPDQLVLLVQPAPAGQMEIDPHDVHPGLPLPMVNQHRPQLEPLTKIDHDLPVLLLLRLQDPRIPVVRSGKRLVGKLQVLLLQLPSVKRLVLSRQRVRRLSLIRSILIVLDLTVHVSTSYLLDYAGHAGVLLFSV